MTKDGEEMKMDYNTDMFCPDFLQIVLTSYSSVIPLRNSLNVYKEKPYRHARDFRAVYLYPNRI